MSSAKVIFTKNNGDVLEFDIPFADISYSINIDRSPIYMWGSYSPVDYEAGPQNIEMTIKGTLSPPTPKEDPWAAGWKSYYHTKTVNELREKLLAEPVMVGKTEEVDPDDYIDFEEFNLNEDDSRCCAGHVLDEFEGCLCDHCW